MKKLVVNNEQCVMCGACTVSCDLLQEDDEGKIVVVDGGVVAADKLAEVNSVIEDCPVGALALEENSRSMADIKADLQQPFRLEFPDKELYRFDKSGYSLPILSGRGEYQYKYSSDEKAEREGLRDFRDSIHSQRKAIAQQVIISYKHDKLLPFIQYAEKAGNYKYETVQALLQRLKNAVAEIEAVKNQKLALPADFFDFKTKDRITVKWVLEYGVDNGWANRIADECEPYDWFDCYVNSDEMATGQTKSHWFSDYDEDVYMYCYKLNEASEKLNNQILDECQYNLTDMADKEIKSEAKAFIEGLQSEWQDKAASLLRLMA